MWTSAVPAVSYETTHVTSGLSMHLSRSRAYANIMPKDIDDDGYIAKLLAEDAKSARKTYELVGLDAFNPKRCVASSSIVAMPQS